MMLYTIQSTEVIYTLVKEKIYFADFEKSEFLCDPDCKELFDIPYRWIMYKFNTLRGHDFSSAPVFWYTDRKQAQLSFLEWENNNKVLIKANVPDKWVLLHNFDRWHHALNNSPCGWDSEKFYETYWFRKLKEVYKKNPLALYESWNEILNIRKGDLANEVIHAVTPFIDYYWLNERKEEISEADRLSQEM